MIVGSSGALQRSYTTVPTALRGILHDLAQPCFKDRNRIGRGPQTQPNLFRPSLQWGIWKSVGAVAACFGYYRCASSVFHFVHLLMKADRPNGQP